MANNPQKTKDAAEEALSAIQEALSLRPPDPRSVTPLGTAEPPVTADLFHEPSQPSDDGAPRRAANDDRASIGQILQTLHRRPNRLPYIIAGARSKSAR